MAAFPKDKPLRDRVYLDYLKTQPCVLTGKRANEREAIDPMHIGTAGKGLKSPDNETLPVNHEDHRYAHSHGETTMLRDHAPDWLIREAFRAYARQLYAAWKQEPPHDRA